jgi:CheY-like chemotaxis protein
MDPSQLTQVMLNLATNARDAMPKGGTLRVESGCASVEEDKAQALGLAGAGLYVSISVSDTGTGMEEATLSHLFEPFFTTKEQGKGTGLGLSTVYGIVRQAGGAVSVQSAHQKGTRVTILLPCVACVPSEKPRPVEAASGQGSGAILLVEDDESVRRYVARLLVRRGYLVHQAADGAQALAELDTLSPAPALLITDLVMPGMTGRELADKVRDRAPRVAVLFVSGYSEDAVVRRGLETGTIDFLRKPFAPNELLSHVARLLGAC